MTDPTNVDDVYVTGQRARGPSPFSSLSFPTKGIGQGPRVPNQNELDPNAPNPDGPDISDETQQCSTDAGRQAWNKDAVAQEAVEKLRTFAINQNNEAHFYYREYGALICEFAGGNIQLGPIYEGDFVGPPTGGRGSVPIDPASCGAGTPVGFIHTHPSSVYASAGDIAYLQLLVDDHGASPSTVAVYTVSTHAAPGGGGTAVHRVSVAKISDQEAVEQEGYEPEWVNPDAQECP